MHLVLCPGCDRQYDVTHVLPQSHVRCVCDAVFVVHARGPLTTEALRCSACGGAAKPGDTECSWCGAALSERDSGATTLCPACMTRMPDHSKHCPGCGIAIQPQKLSPLPEERGCPRCTPPGDASQPEGELRIRDLGAGSVIECARCNGLWLEPGGLERLVRRTEKEGPAPSMGSVTKEDIPKRSLGGNFEGYIPCLRCDDFMVRRQHRYWGSGSGVVVDYCRHHGVWLDGGELESILTFVQSQSFGPEGPRARLEAAQTKRESRSVPMIPVRQPTPMEKALRFLADLVETLLRY